MHVLHTYFNQQRWWSNWGRGEGEKKEGKPQDIRGRESAERQMGRPLCFSIGGDGAEHVLISHNATHCVISCYALCQCITSTLPFEQPSLISWPQTFILRLERSDGRLGAWVISTLMKQREPQTCPRGPPLGGHKYLVHDWRKKCVWPMTQRQTYINKCIGLYVK